MTNEWAFDDEVPDIPPDANVVISDREFGTQVMNQSEFATDQVLKEGRVVGSNQPIMAALSSWVNTTRGGNRNGGLFERDRYVTPSKIFEQMALAYHAVQNDDIVSNVADASEAMAFNSVGFYADDAGEEDVYNQIARDINLDARLREMWRELFIVSQFTVGVWWHTKTFKPRGTGDGGRKRRKEYRIRCPRALTILDPTKVIPVGNTMFNQESLAYAAERSEHEAFLSPNPDPIRDRLLMGRYEPSMAERSELANLGGDVSPDRLWLLNPANVFRHAVTRSQHERFAAIRMVPAFELLDLKEQTRQMDRAHLLGASNFILLIRKGTDERPAQPEEIAHLQASVRTVARVPVMVGDHRLDVKIVTPSTDNTLSSEKYNLLDGRLTALLYRMFVLGSGGSGASGDDSLKLAAMISRGMESRRQMLVRTLEVNILDEIFDRNPELTTRPKLRFHPKDIDLNFNDAKASFMMELRDRGELSRHSALAQFGFDQDDEARYLEREAVDYDNIFKTINPNNQGVGQATQPPKGVDGQPVPGAGPANPAPNTNGDPAAGRRAAREGRRKGGAAPGSGQGKAPRNPSRLSNQEEPNDEND